MNALTLLKTDNGRTDEKLDSGSANPPHSSANAPHRLPPSSHALGHPRAPRDLSEFNGLDRWMVGKYEW